MRPPEPTIEVEERPASPRRREFDWFFPVLAVVVAIGLAVRLGAVSVTAPPRYLTDATYFRVQGLLFVRGHGFVDPFIWSSQHRFVASAFHPPLFSVVLGRVTSRLPAR